MVPDLPGVLGLMFLRPLTHALAAAFTLDVLLTALVALIWTGGLRATLAEAFPPLGARWAATTTARHRPWRSQPQRSRLLLAWYLAAAIGSLSHLLWDGLTHAEAGADIGLPLLDSEPGLATALQLVSSVLGLLVLALWTRRWWRRADVNLPLLMANRSPSSRRTTAVVIVVAVLAPLLLALERVLVIVVLRRGLTVDDVLVGEATFGALAGGLAGAVLLAVRHRWTHGKRASETAETQCRTQDEVRTRMR